MTSLINTHSDAPWRDRALPVRDRVETLPAAESAPMPDGVTASTSSDADDLVHGGIGHLTRVFGTALVTVAKGVERVVAGNRFGIPAIVHEECLSGFATYGATACPTPPAWATFDVALVREMAAAIGHRGPVGRRARPSRLPPAADHHPRPAPPRRRVRRNRCVPTDLPVPSVTDRWTAT